MSFFYEIRSPDNSVLKRNGGFLTVDAAKVAAREDAKKMKLSKHLGVASVGKILVGQTTTRASQSPGPPLTGPHALGLLS